MRIVEGVVKFGFVKQRNFSLFAPLSHSAMAKHNFFYRFCASVLLSISLPTLERERVWAMLQSEMSGKCCNMTKKKRKSKACENFRNAVWKKREEKFLSSDFSVVFTRHKYLLSALSPSPATRSCRRRAMSWNWNFSVNDFYEHIQFFTEYKARKAVVTHRQNSITDTSDWVSTHSRQTFFFALKLFPVWKWSFQGPKAAEHVRIKRVYVMLRHRLIAHSHELFNESREKLIYARKDILLIIQSLTRSLCERSWN